MTLYAEQLSNAARKQIAVWLLLCCAMIFAMVILGGVTRLTGSGLSMVEWDPIFGVIPPLDQQAWEEVFAKYRESPEYRKINVGMDLDGFKSIYWFEYAHRVLGRSIGTVFLIPFLYFLFRGMLTRRLAPRLAIAFLLGGLQGLLGWYMVKSGLIDRPHVSQYRLTAHLGLALVIYCYLLWLTFDLLFPQRASSPHSPAAHKGALYLLALAAVTVMSGGFVAGLKAGFAYNTFPKMGDQWLPPAAWMLEPAWRNLFENVATVQFNHRVLAIATFISVLGFWLYAMRNRLAATARIASHLALGVATVQFSLGVATLLLHVPVALAATHQAGAVALLTALLFLNHRVRKGESPPLPSQHQ
jgi:cytochrome c oxidase assembly protein subunit 15